MPKFSTDGGEGGDSAMDAASAILIKRGFHIGREVKTTKRTTTSVVTDGTTTRHDVPQNTNAFIVCVRGASVRISTLLNMKDGLVPIEFNMNSDSLALWDGAKDDEQKIKPGKAQKVKTFDIVLGDSDPSDVSVKVAWHKQAESACATELFEAFVIDSGVQLGVCKLCLSDIYR